MQCLEEAIQNSANQHDRHDKLYQQHATTAERLTFLEDSLRDSAHQLGKHGKHDKMHEHHATLAERLVLFEQRMMLLEHPIQVPPSRIEPGLVEPGFSTLEEQASYISCLEDAIQGLEDSHGCLDHKLECMDHRVSTVEGKL